MVIWAVFISVIAVSLLLGLRMSFDEPKPFVFAARDFPEHIRSLSILQLSRLTNGFADFAPESASVRRFEGTHHKNITVREQDRPRYPLRPQRVDARKCLPLGPAARAQHSCNDSAGAQC